MKKELHLLTRWRKAQRVLLLMIGVIGVMFPASAQTQVYSNAFASSNDFNAMTVIDANNDGKTWTYNSSGYAQYTYSSSNAANDWLITPGITLEAGKTYQFNIEAWARSTYYTEKLEVKMGSAATAAGMTTSVIASTGITSTSAEQLSNNSVTVTTTGVYYFGVHAISAANMWELYVDNLVITDVTPPYPIPTNLAVSDITAHSAKATWDGNANAQSYNLRYREVGSLINSFFDDFESGLNNWTIYTDGEAPNTNGWVQYNPTNGLEFDAVSGDYVASAWSWASTVYDADNWLITPQVTFDKKLKFWVRTNSGYPDEYAVLLSTTGNAESDFTVTLQAMATAPAVSDWTQVTIDLSAYENQTGYIAIHHVSNDCNYLLIDDFSIGHETTTGEWETIPNAVSPQDITGLNPSTEYEVQVQAVYADGSSDWTNSVYFTTAAADAMPFGLTVTDVTDCTANTSWNGSQDSYNLRYRKMTFFESFETFPGNWTIVDSNEDGYTWSQVDLTTQFSGSYTAVEGTNVAMSRSWINSTVGAVQPDNWLISPKVELGGILKYFVMDELGYPETYRIYVSTNGTDIADFQPLTDDLQTPNQNKWVECTADLSAYNGQQGYIAFRHYNCYDQSFMFIDAVSIGDNWTTVNNVTSPKTITGLDAESDYEVEVQGVLDNSTTNWTLPVYFTTLEAVSRPMTLAELVANGEVGIRYTISEPLLAVYSVDNKLWLKDDNKFANPASPAEGDQNYEIEEQGNPHANQAEYDQSNWIEAQLPEGVDASIFNGHMINTEAITGVLGDKTNPVMTGVTLTEGDIDDNSTDTGYEYNYYCTANFVGPQNGTIAGETYHFFFMTPKPQECAKVVWAQYDAETNKMVMPDAGNAHGFVGAVDVDLSLNGGTDPVDGKVYNFIAVIRTTTSKAGNYKVYPLNISEAVITAVNDITSKTVAGVKYYNLAGIESDRPFEGVNIIVTTYTDGTTSATKVMK